LLILFKYILLVKDIIHYRPKQFSPEEKKQLTSVTATEETLGGPVEVVADVFYNEMSKREIGKKKCMDYGCTHFISMDADEYYLRDQLKFAKELVEECNFDGTACRYKIICGLFSCYLNLYYLPLQNANIF
jgi:hypothetical protein